MPRNVDVKITTNDGSDLQYNNNDNNNNNNRNSSNTVRIVVGKFQERT
jgi:hypothetical protein